MLYDASDQLFRASDKLTAIAIQVNEHKNLRRQREIDAKATAMMLRGDDPMQVEQFLVNEMMPQRRGGLGGLADRFFGTPQGVSPMQQQVMTARGQAQFPTPDQQARQQAVAQQAERHPLEMEHLRAQTERLRAMSDPTMQQLGSVGDVLGRLTRDPLVARDYADEIQSLLQSYQSLVGRLVGTPNNGAAATPWEGPNPGVLPMSGQKPGQQPSSPARPNLTPETKGSGRMTTPKAKQDKPLPKMSMDTPPQLQQRIQRLLQMGAPIEDILEADEVKPYVIRE